MTFLASSHFKRSGFLLALLFTSFSALAQQAPQAAPYALLTVEKYDQFGMAEMLPCEAGEQYALNDPRRPAPQPQGPYCGHPYQVPYFGGVPGLDNAPAAERETYRQVIIGGVPYAALPPHTVYPDGVWYYVMDKFGNFFFFSKVGTQVHHSSFFDGAPIASGGQIQVSGGKVTAINTETGHYQMNDTIMQNAEQALSDDGVLGLNTNLSDD